MTAHTSLV